MTTTTIQLHPLIGKILIIHVKTFLDREVHMREQLGRFGIAFEFVLDHDAVEITDDIDHQYFLPDAPLNRAAKSCCLKHLLAMQTIAALPAGQFGLVLEDDVMLADDFVERVREAVDEATKLPKPLTVQLGCANNMHVPRHLLQPSRRLYPASQVRATDSYLIDPEGARRRVDYLTANKIAFPADHLFNLVDTACKIQFYWLEPTVVEQGSMKGRFVSAIDDKRSDRSLAAQFFHYHLKKFRVAVFDPIFRRNRRF